MICGKWTIGIIAAERPRATTCTRKDLRKLFRWKGLSTPPEVSNLNAIHSGTYNVRHLKCGLFERQFASADNVRTVVSVFFKEK